MKPFMKENGNLEESEYLVFHRIAVAADVQGQGVAQTFLEGLIEGFDYLDFRSDTHVCKQGHAAYL